MKCIYISYIMYHVSYIIYLSCIIYNIIIYICIYNIIIVYHTIVFVDGRFLATAQGVCSTQVGDRELGSRGSYELRNGFFRFPRLQNRHHDRCTSAESSSVIQAMLKNIW